MEVQVMIAEKEKEVSIVNLFKGRYLILRELFPEKEFFLRELATMMEIDDSNLSRYITKLEEVGLVISRNEPRTQGKPYKYVRLTALGKNIVNPIIEAAQTPQEELKPADPENIEFYLKMMGPEENENIRQIASEELVILCREHDVTNDDKVLPFIKKAMKDLDYIHILPNLLHALHNIVRNTKNEEIRKSMQSDFKETLRELVVQRSETQSEKVARMRYSSLEVLTALSNNKETYTELMGLFRSLIEEEAPFAHAARQLILSKHPDKKNEMRRTLFKMLTNQDEGIKHRVEGHIRELRK